MPNWRLVLVVFIVACVSVPLLETKRRKYENAYLRDWRQNKADAELVDARKRDAAGAEELICIGMAIVSGGSLILSAALVPRHRPGTRGFEVIR